MKTSIRTEEDKDHLQVENLTREAFWNLYKPGCDEHLLVHNLRKSPAFVAELCLVACEGEKIVGNIVYSKAKVIGEGGEFEVLCMGPLSVLPELQKRGTGSLLMRHSIDKARELGYTALIIFGDPGYYRRFGFISASEFGITTSSGDSFDAFMALELKSGSLNGISGRFFEDGAFRVDRDELELFEKGFPYKEKLITPTQLNFDLK